MPHFLEYYVVPHCKSQHIFFISNNQWEFNCFMVFEENFMIHIISGDKKQTFAFCRPLMTPCGIGIYAFLFTGFRVLFPARSGLRLTWAVSERSWTTNNALFWYPLFRNWLIGSWVMTKFGTSFFATRYILFLSSTKIPSILKRSPCVCKFLWFDCRWFWF